jgi:hypothetical protein
MRAICRHVIEGWVASRSSGAFNSLADLQQADTDGVKDQPVGQIATVKVGTNRVDRGLDIGQPLTLLVTHSEMRAGPDGRRCRSSLTRSPRVREPA